MKDPQPPDSFSSARPETAGGRRAPASRPSVWKKELPAVLLFLVLSLAMTAPLPWKLSDHVPGDMGDPLFTIWNMSVQAEKLKSGLSGISGYWDANIFHPHKNVLLYADTIFALTVMNMPLVLVGGNPVAAYNILFILSFFICAAGTYALVLSLTRSRSAAVIAGLIASFFPYNFAHVHHLELLSFGWIPLCFLFLHRFFDRPSYKNLAGVGFFFVLQALTCAHYGLFLTLFAALFIIYFGYKKRLFKKWGFWLKMGVLAAGCGVILLPFFLPYLRVHERISSARGWIETSYYSAQPQHFLSVPAWNRVWGGVLGDGDGSLEWRLFPGLAAVLLCALWWALRRKERTAELRAEKNGRFFWWDIGLALFAFLILQIWWSGGFTFRLAGVKALSLHSLTAPLMVFCLVFLLRLFFAWRRKRGETDPAPGPSSESLAQRFYLFAAGFAFLLSLGPVIKFLDRKIMAGPYLLLFESFPFFKAVRSPSRFAIIMMLALSVLAGWGVLKLGERWVFFKKKIAVILIGGVILAEYVSVPLPLAAVRRGDDTPPIYRTVKDLPQNSVLLELPLGEDPDKIAHGARYMFYSTYHGKKLVNGYSGYFPPGYLILREAMRSFPSHKTIALLRNLGVDYVLVHTEGFRAKISWRTAARLKMLSDNFEFIHRSERDFLFRLLPPSAPEGRERGPRRETGRRELWRADAGRNTALAHLAVDGNEETAWTTGMQQLKGDFFSLDLGEELPLSEISTLVGRSPMHYPRAYRLEGSTDGETWALLDEDMNGFPDIDASMVEHYSRYRMRFRFEPSLLRHLRFTLLKDHPLHHWSIGEITCFE